jgi:hypothetical protein
MKFELNKYRPGTLIIIATAVALSACGGGGGGGDSAAAPAAAPAPTVTATWAASGSYSPVLKLQGNASATPLSIALSLVHPSRPDVEYVLDTSASPMRLGLTLERGTYSSTTKQITGLTPAAFIDSPAGRVRSTSLQANGQRPLQALSAAVSLCDSSIVARNFAAPYSSQIAVDSPGADGICETPDDVQALVTFSSSGVPTAAVNVLGKMLGYFTSDITGEPLSWVMSSPTGQIVTLPIGPTGNALTFTVPPAIPLATKPVFKPVVNLNNLLVFSQDGGLRSLNASVNPPTLNNLSVLSGPDGWKSAGSDANHVYVYLNSATAASGTGNWSIDDDCHRFRIDFCGRDGCPAHIRDLDQRLVRQRDSNRYGRRRADAVHCAQHHFNQFCCSQSERFSSGGNLQQCPGRIDFFQHHRQRRRGDFGNSKRLGLWP